MSQPVEVLVVCLGNVCRSPVAERLLRVHLDRLGVDASQVRVSSAGAMALVGAPIDELAAAELVRLGGDPAGHASRQLTPAMVEQADLVLTATLQLRSRVLEEAPRALRRTFTIRELPTVTPVEADSVADLVAAAAASRGAAQSGDLDVPDPIGQPPGVHREVAAVLDEACSAIAGRLAAAVRAPA